MKGGGRSDDEKEESTGRTQGEDQQVKVKLKRGAEDEEEEDIHMMVSFRDGNKATDGDALISSSFSVLSSSVCRGGGDEDEVQISLVTVDDESCPSEPFGPAHIDPANLRLQTEDEGGKGDEHVERKGDEEANREERELHQVGRPYNNKTMTTVSYLT